MNLLLTFLNESFENFESAACLTGDGLILGLKYENVVDIGTLGQAGLTAIKYFSPQMGDVILLNDPYSGGSLLSMLTLVTPLCPATHDGPALYWVVRTGFRAHLALSQKLDEEGLRIPPTPIAEQRKINPMILEAIQDNPLAPDELGERIETVLGQVWPIVDHINLLRKTRPQEFQSKAISFLYDESQRKLRQILTDFPTGESQSETRLDSGELIRLLLSLTPQNVVLDFSGTSSSKRICLTDAATFGACFGGLMAFLQNFDQPQKPPLPLNSGSFSLLQVTSPLGCLLNAKFPSPTFRGMTEGCSQVAGTVVNTLGELMPQRRRALAAQAPVQIGLFFESGKRFFDAVAGGSGATATQNGEDGVLLWVRNHLKNSVQQIENRFPLQIESIQVRSQSAGLGLHNGGHGLIKVYRLLAPAQLKWLMPSKLSPFLGYDGGRAGQAPEIEIQRAGGEKQIILAEEGILSLQVEDRIVVKSPGGGGFGATS